MKLLHINTNDISGGAAIAAYRLHKAMRNCNIDSELLALHQSIKDQGDILTLPKTLTPLDLYHRLKEKIWSTIYLSNKQGRFSRFKFGIKVTKYIDISKYNVIYLHWVNDSFINYQVLKKILKSGKPVFWVLHDMFPITGGCHHSFDCDKYQSVCNYCPYIKKKRKKDISFYQQKKKAKIFNKYKNLFFISPSKWLFDSIKKSFVTKTNKVFHIPNIIPENNFKPVDTLFSRDCLGLEYNKKIILFGADSALSNPYKGFEYFSLALQALAIDPKIKRDDIEVLIFGSSYNKTIAEILPFKTHFLGKLSDVYSLNLAYNAANLFCVSSLADNLPNTILESLATHTPVVGFNIGGIPDLVNLKTGYLANYKDIDDLKNGIMKCLYSSKLFFDFSSISNYSAVPIINKHFEMIEWVKRN
ncbi:glycosyltransferase [Breznakiella homolactica]|uniref:Glycosyltransferase n=1 Tax=Breznakiella homolactica TaxID=2798577 RepID=A0A7T7XP26_9SPIR|nr:glycosyltransferase [Breznakiella homolactica]QQO09822.1 glycosyltransferase [Breznakiella homolactica]